MKKILLVHNNYRLQGGEEGAKVQGAGQAAAAQARGGAAEGGDVRVHVRVRQREPRHELTIA